MQIFTTATVRNLVICMFCCLLYTAVGKYVLLTAVL